MSATRAALADRRAMLTDTPGGPIESTLVGSGPTVLVVHGGHSNCREELGVAALVEAGHTVWIPSRPGYGATPLSVGETAEAAADALAAAALALDLEPIAAIGVSAGGPTAIHLAARHPRVVDRLILASAVTKIWHQSGDGRYETMQRLFGRWGGATWGSTRAMCRWLPRWMVRTMMSSMTDRDVGRVMRSLAADEVAEIVRMIGRQASGRGFLADLEHRVGSEVLAAVDVPTLVVHSPYDAAVPFEHAEHAVGGIPGARRFDAPSPCGHLIWFGPGHDAVDAAIVDFLAAGRA